MQVKEEDLMKVNADFDMLSIKHQDEVSNKQDYMVRIDALYGQVRLKDDRIHELQEEIENFLKRPQFTKHSQTERNVDIPYLITDKLPPIFSKYLRWNTPQLKFLPKSMPDLSKICWSDFSSHDLDLGNDVLDYDEYYDSSLSDQEAS